MPVSGLHSRTVECKPRSCSGKVNAMGMSNKLGFMQQLPWPPHPTESVKVHACWVAQVDLKKKGIFVALSPATLRAHAHRQKMQHQHHRQQPHTVSFSQLWFCYSGRISQVFLKDLPETV